MTASTTNASTGAHAWTGSTRTHARVSMDSLGPVANQLLVRETAFNNDCYYMVMFKDVAVSIKGVCHVPKWIDLAP